MASRKYSKTWEDNPLFKDWIRPVPGEPNCANCKYCKCNIRAHKKDLENHSGTQKHKKASAPFSGQRTLFDTGVQKTEPTSVKVAELKLAAHVACHSSISTIDHLGEIANSLSDRDIKLHRTKCTALIKTVLGAQAQKDLLADLKDTPYSLLVDESTDITTSKQMAVVIRYFSTSQKTFVTSFLGIVELDSGTAAAMTETLLEFLLSCSIDIMNCVGIATDGCNAMCGVNNSVISRLRGVNPGIIHIKCICHSLQLCASHAVKCLPRNVEYMLSETYNYFSHSTLRQLKYKELYSTINVGEAPLKILQLADTRWLSIAPCINRVLDQYIELKLHFQVSQDNDKSYAAMLLYEMYNDPRNKLYLLFLQPIVNETNRVNKLFQLDSGNPMKLMSELMALYHMLLNKTMRPATLSDWDDLLNYDIANERNHLPIAAIEYGVKFNLELADMGMGDRITNEIVTEIKTRCKDYMLEMLRQLRKRLPDNAPRLRHLSDIDPSRLLSADPNQRPKFSSLSFLPLCKGDLSVIETQFNKLHIHKWNNSSDCSPEEFWIEVSQHTDAAGTCDYEELASFMLGIMTLPFSNAAVERTFSQMKLIKTEHRNRMGQGLLQSILHVRAYMSRKRICCNKFVPTSDMLKAFTSQMYENDTNSFPTQDCPDVDLGASASGSLL